ncbi:hypothetical protein A8F94_16700 [Bacillus sp. FJAT-27225]|uniref:hypothetical protein n=1 Tax=Bacillus sp. FJAT-27225 TaxID=1743144 RepID=UPI00080C2C19|nr:hypothetical protein [Bacillus sp. FJAT-27225]OCA84346.1 hypothetical protein A8F94_16700 [Bacillus sp. FJAT-27225]
MTSFFFALASLFILGCLYFIVLYAKGGMYPPRQLVRRRAVQMAAGAGIFFFVGAVTWLIKH